MTPQVLEKLKSVEARYDELMRLVSDASIQADPPTYRKHSKELVDAYREHQRVQQEVADTRELAASGDAEMRELAAGEISGLESRAEALETDIQRLLIPKDP